MAEHRYSTFALDLYRIDATRDPDLARHVAECEQCGSYVAHLDALEARPLILPTPAPRRRWWLPVAFAVAAIVAIVIVLRRPTDEAPHIAAKGAPAVEVLVHRATATTVWDPAQPIRPGDALALHVACETMTRATVLVADHGRWTTAYAGECTNALPFSLTVDREPGAERIVVVLSTHSLDDVTAAAAADAQTRSADVWALAFDFAKETAP